MSKAANPRCSSLPSGASLLVDTGWPGNNGRDAERIQAAMHDAGITRIDHVLITHYHADHVGGVPDLVTRVQVGEFLDHGPNREDSDITRHDYAAYLKAIAGQAAAHRSSRRHHPHPRPQRRRADRRWRAHLRSSRHQAHAQSVLRQRARTGQLDPTENARSAGILVTFGKFRFLDLGDLTGPKRVALVCPDNPIGTVDLYLVDHHGMNLSNSRAFVDAIHPRVAIMNNGAHKAGMPEAWQTVHDSPGLEDLWQLHTAEDSDAAHNSPEALIANPKGDGDGAYLKVVASPRRQFLRDQFAHRPDQGVSAQ